ncbi:MAG: winged helix-turn-helix domain-containing protein [Hyphomonas sp.]|uniref:winged helix-turn-helix domain-containing protein n=1 Tax=Hyphomonas sp. TaxID=87 RepID=UPI001839F9AE|nr:crosslink repair DNA glycosylase YcaQ family protein [Hyphomonas sp.]MBU3918992.1 winged helix DNA-binding domain-containing protein [Alphaproteobacteria bacterium]MBA3069606.1 winged helix-turn-helix domain-containing protein [Hyphomonas sp.]MBU4063233.1 winged helix DNA-binding domain-containing protein [Alphaproteobacteria bacterium]MBU4164051.1 winged helix DNA-binding domain-containing protein [Alphaproteobacteria bacterium]MBU4569384.1 winged helix DNA-binding domain-containing protei
MALRISNREARRLWLDAQGLSGAPTGPVDLPGMIRKLGFVQLDTIRVVARAHDHILWSRNQNYREPMLEACLGRDRQVFEHFTHDASVIPMDFYPMWRRQFRRLEEKVRGWEWHRGMLDEPGRAAIRARIEAEGPLSTKAFDTKVEGKREMWRRPPHKLALDYMWYAGELSTSHREGFTKFYDLTHRVIPDHHRAAVHDDAVQVDWLCREALARLAFGTPGDIQRFWAAAELGEVKAWTAERAGELVEVEIESVNGQWTAALALADIEARLAAAPAPAARLRILNPFDPVIRDRGRLTRLFGFDYRIEIFVPEAKRQWGYYVYPLLEGDRFVGRIEVKADRQAGELSVHNLWPEPGVKWTDARQAKLEAELGRLARLAGADDVVWQAG